MIFVFGDVIVNMLWGIWDEFVYLWGGRKRLVIIDKVMGCIVV